MLERREDVQEVVAHCCPDALSSLDQTKAMEKIRTELRKVAGCPVLLDGTAVTSVVMHIQQ